MSFPESFIVTNAIRSNYGIIGHLSLLQNPVMKLTSEDFEKCREDMMRLRKRFGDRKHLFRKEMIGALLKAHVLDLYDIHAQADERAAVSSRPAAGRANIKMSVEVLITSRDCVFISQFIKQIHVINKKILCQYKNQKSNLI